MAVLVRKKLLLRGREVEAIQYLPPGVLSKEDRVRAESLDRFLSVRMPRIGADLRERGLVEGAEIERWHALGVHLREFADDGSLVDSKDRESGILWAAVRQHSPPELLPARAPIARAEHEKPWREGHMYDHFAYCYWAGLHDWKAISWLRRWSDWISIVEVPAIRRDWRIFVALRDHLAHKKAYPRRDAFRRILTRLREEFSTKQYRDTSVLSRKRIDEIVRDAVRDIAG